MNKNISYVNAFVIFLDAVKYSDLVADVANDFVYRLHAACKSWDIFVSARNRESVTFHNSGDGFALCFFDNLYAPLECARLLATTPMPLRIRVGIHRGVVARGQIDPNGNEQPIGEGINFAARVMDQAEAGQILLSKEYVDDLRKATEHYNGFLHDLGERTVKHGVSVQIVNFYDGVAGIPPPGGMLPLAGKKIALLYKHHLRNDERLVEILETGFRLAGAEVSVEKQFPAGAEWRQQIQQKAESTDACIPLLSEASQGSEMLEEEVRVFNNAQKKPRLLPVRIGYEGPLIEPLAAILDPLPYFLWNSESDDERLVAELTHALLEPPPAPRDAPVGPLGSGTGAIPLDSSYYITRNGDGRLNDAVARGEGVIRIKGSRQVGKTSLLNRALHEAGQIEGVSVVRTDYQAFIKAELTDLPTFYKALARKLQRALSEDMELPDIDSVWKDRGSPNDSFEDYLLKYVLKLIPGTLLWGMDEVDRLFTTGFKSDVFGFFRSWYNLRASKPNHPLCRLTLIFSYATEAALFITDLNQSPFNVGVDIPLSDFTESELAELNRRFGSPLPDEVALARFRALVGGHPFLAHRALIELVRQGMTLEQFEAEADTDTGLFGDHLRRILFSTSEELIAVLRAVTAGKPCPDDKSFFRLCEAGVLLGNDHRQPQFRCGIYRTYLSRHLSGT